MKQTCDTCRGKGVVNDTIERGNVLDCPHCNGYGQIPDDNFAYDEMIDNQLTNL